ncbi:MAG: T9SS type A sorting domain-containing protein [Gillisia sp.]
MKLITFTGNKETRSHLGGALERKKMPAISNSFFGVVCIVLLMAAPLYLTAQNIQGVAPVQTPLGGFAVDGNAYVRLLSPLEPGGDLFFERTTPPPLITANPGGLFHPDFFSNPPIPIETGEYTYENSEYLIYPNTYFYRDDITNNDPTIFTSSNKINDNPNTYTWGAGSSPNKNEIQNALAHFTWGVGENSEDLWMIFAADRQVTNGSSYIDFEILQNSLTREGTTSGTFATAGPDGGRTLGDLLVTLEFTQGGGEATVVIRRWEASGSGFEYMVVSEGADYPDYPEGSIYISNNTEETIVPFSIYNQDPIASGEFAGYFQYDTNQWAEGAVNISALFDQADPCLQISTLFIRTRTSGSSGQSELKDFPGGPIQLSLDLTPDPPMVADVENCGPWEGTLEATECDGTVKWYDEEFEGTLLHTGASYDPGEITETTSFWVSCTVNDCEGPRTEVTVTIYDIPDFDVTDLESCEEGETGAASFDLNDAISNEDLGTLSFYTSEADAMVPQNAIVDPTNVSVMVSESPETFWARLDNDDDGEENCHTIKSIDVYVYDNPDLMVDDLEDCEDGETGSQTFDLNDAVSDDGGGTLSFYESETNAEKEENAIGDPTSVSVSIADSPKTFWVRTDNDDDGEEGCHTIKSFTVTVSDNPGLMVENLEDCEATDTGSQTFDLNDAVTDDGGGDLSFYESELDATNEENAIGDPTSVSVSIGDSPKTFWVRSENESNEDCFSIESFTVTVYDNPDLMVTDLDDCEEGTTGAQTFDLNDAVSDADGGSLSFYESELDATNEENAIADETSVSVSIVDSPKTFWVRSDNPDDGEEGCYSIASFDVTVYDNPDVTTTNPEPICEGESVDLANYVTDADGGTLSYHTTLLDAEGNMNALMSTIVSPALGSHDYFVRSENTEDSECYSVATITVTVITCIVDQGCTLGYWKQHTDRWCDAYQTCDLYGDVFANAPAELAGLTLLEVLNLGGGGIYNLARQSVAALLNTCSSEVGFYYSDVDLLIAYVNNAFVSGKNAISMAGSYLDGLNNQYCPLGGTPATTEPSPGCEVSRVSAAEADVVNSETSVVEKSFSVSPVPFRESLSVKYDFDYVSPATIQMYDMQGRLLSTHTEANASKGKITNLSINFRTLPSQVYVIKVTTDRDVFTKKIVSDK